MRQNNNQINSQSSKSVVLLTGSSHINQEGKSPANSQNPSPANTPGHRGGR